MHSDTFQPLAAAGSAPTAVPPAGPSDPHDRTGLRASPESAVRLLWQFDSPGRGPSIAESLTKRFADVPAHRVAPTGCLDCVDLPFSPRARPVHPISPKAPFRSP